MASDEDRARMVVLLVKLAGDLEACLAIADACDEHVVAANLENALSLVEERLAGYRAAD